MGVSPKIIELRKILAERFPKENAVPSFRISTGSVLLDSVLGGGLPRCGITELIIPNRSSGSAVLLQEIIDGMHQQSQFIALVDAKNSFDPFSDHSLLLWIRCLDAATAIKATDLILRDGNVPFTILDLKPNPKTELRKIPAITWYRFQRIAEDNRTTLLTFTPYQLVTSAQLTVLMTNQLKIEDLTSLRSRIIAADSLQILRNKVEYKYA